MSPPLLLQSLTSPSCLSLCHFLFLFFHFIFLKNKFSCTLNFSVCSFVDSFLAPPPFSSLELYLLSFMEHYRWTEELHLFLFQKHSNFESPHKPIYLSNYHVLSFSTLKQAKQNRKNDFFNKLGWY